MDYGTGAIFGCPAHDQSYDFANKYNKNHKSSFRWQKYKWIKEAMQVFEN